MPDLTTDRLTREIVIAAYRASDSIGASAPAGGGGILNYLNIGLNKALSLPTALNQSLPTGSGDPIYGAVNGIDIQSERAPNVSARSPGDVVIGRNSGVVNALVGVDNLVVGLTCRVIGRTTGSTSQGRNVVMGIASYISPSGTASPYSGFNVAIGTLCSAETANEYVVAMGSQVTVGSVIGTPNSQTDIAAVGCQISVLAEDTGVGASAAVALGTRLNVQGKFTQAIVNLGVFNNIGDSQPASSLYNCSGVIGIGLSKVESKSGSLWVGVGDYVNTGHMAIIDLQTTGSQATSVIRIGREGSSVGIPGGAGTSICRQMAYESRRVVASSATPYAVPNVASVIIFTGTTSQTINLPPNPLNGHAIKFKFPSGLTPTFVANTGQTIENDSPGAQAAGRSIELFFHKGTTLIDDDGLTALAIGGTANRWY